MTSFHHAAAQPLVPLATGLIRAYQLVVRPMYIRDRCRFYPSCSDYALQAFAAHGPLRGLWLTVRRLGRCHPFHPGGIDHVPSPPAEQRARTVVG
ncbi:MAG: membrane protein insertion efficiency factor YidD [Egibacteraceae bacterium]